MVTQLTISTTNMAITNMNVIIEITSVVRPMEVDSLMLSVLSFESGSLAPSDVNL